MGRPDVPASRRSVSSLAELAPIVRRGGMVVVADPDYSTQSVAGPDPALAARVLAFRCDSIRNGRLASGMTSLFGHAGLGEGHSERHEIVVRRPDAFDRALGLRDWAALAAERDLVSRAETRKWSSPSTWLRPATALATGSRSSSRLPR